MILSADPAANERSPLIGRDPELMRINAVLEQGRPATIVVTGDESQGKSRLLREVRARLAHSKWQVAPAENQAGLRIDEETTEESFARQLGELLHLSTGDTLFTTFDLRGERINTQPAYLQGLSLPAQKTTIEETGHLHNIFLDKKPSGETPSSGQMAAWRDPPARTRPATQSMVPVDPILHPLLRKLRQMAPLLLLIEEYRPNQRFAGWFSGHFLAGLHQSDLSIVVALAGRPQFVQELKDVASEYILLGHLDPEGVRRYLEQLSSLISPPLTGDELVVYTKNIDEPAAIESLSSLLHLLITEEARV